MTPPLPTLSGPVPVMPTMFAGGALDRDGQSRLSRRLVMAGLPTLVVGGLEGEGPNLTLAEHLDVVAVGLDAGAVVGASICAPGTDRACEAARCFSGSGVSFLVVSPPPYNRPTPDGILAHVARIAEAGGLPIVLRDDPARTRALLTGDVVTRLCRDGSVAAVVLPPGDMRASRRIDVLSHGEVQSLAGSDFDAILQQCDDRAAWLSSAAVVDPVRCRALHEARLHGDWRTAALLSRELCRLMRALDADESAVTVKVAAKLMGIGSGAPRLPLVAPSSEVQQTIANALSALDLVGRADRRVAW